MKRILCSIALLLSLVLSASGQSMSDTQVLQYIQREMKAGTSQSQIAVHLMQRGVDMKQIQRVRQQYEKQSGNAMSGSSGSASSTGSTGHSTGDSRLRQSNGAVRVDQNGSPLYTSTDGYNALGREQAEPTDLDRRPNVYVKDSVNLLVNGKKVFGRDIFNKRSLSFEPSMNIATPTSYVVGPGDKVFVDVYGASQKSDQFEVSPDGTIVIADFGPIHIAGLTVSQANEKIKDQLGQRYRSSRIQMTAGQTRTITVNVMGEVSVPGTYAVSAFVSVFHALLLVVAVSGVGPLRNITL